MFASFKAHLSRPVLLWCILLLATCLAVTGCAARGAVVTPAGTQAPASETTTEERNGLLSQSEIEEKAEAQRSKRTQEIVLAVLLGAALLAIIALAAARDFKDYPLGE